MKNHKYGGRKIAALLIIIAGMFLLGIGILTKRICPNKIAANAYAVKGMDVSHHQGAIAWEQVERQGIDFAFIKATEGSAHTDENFHQNWAQAEENGILAGAYHFFSFDSPGASQAEHYIRMVGDLSGRLRPVVDVEFYGDKEINRPAQDAVWRELAACLQAIEAEYAARPILYTTYKFYGLYLKEGFEEYPLWIRNVYYPPLDMGARWEFWQYTDRGQLEGMQGREPYVDLNVFRGSWEELGKFVVPERGTNGDARNVWEDDFMP